jgi:hypothetical protein
MGALEHSVRTLDFKLHRVKEAYSTWTNVDGEKGAPIERVTMAQA